MFFTPLQPVNMPRLRSRTSRHHQRYCLGWTSDMFFAGGEPGVGLSEGSFSSVSQNSWKLLKTNPVVCWKSSCSDSKWSGTDSRKTTTETRCRISLPIPKCKIKQATLQFFVTPPGNYHISPPNGGKFIKKNPHLQKVPTAWGYVSSQGGYYEDYSLKKLTCPLKINGWKMYFRLK